jgi:hypothetical protein
MNPSFSLLHVWRLAAAAHTPCCLSTLANRLFVSLTFDMLRHKRTAAADVLA